MCVAVTSHQMAPCLQQRHMTQALLYGIHTLARCYSNFGQSFHWFSVRGKYVVNLYKTCHSITCFWLSSNCMSYARSFVSSLSSIKTKPPWECSYFSVLNWRHPRTFHKASGSNTKTVTQWSTKFAQKCSSKSTSEKFIEWTDWHYGKVIIALSYASSVTQQLSDRNISECALMSKDDFLGI